MSSKPKPEPSLSPLRPVLPNEQYQEAETTTRFRVTPEQADAFKSLPVELQKKLGPPVYGQVLSARALRAMVDRARHTESSSTIMCPW